MKLNYTHKPLTVSLFFVALVVLTQSVPVTLVHAQDASFEEIRLARELEAARSVAERQAKIESLTASVEAIAAAIEASTSIAPADRLVLFTQLLELSRVITALERGNALEAVALRVERDTDPRDRVNLADTGLHRVKVELDMDTFEADITELYLDADDDLERDPFGVEYDRVERKVTLIPANPLLPFPDQVDFAREQVVELLIDEQGYTNEVEVGSAVLMSAVNPKRMRSVSQNSPLAQELFDDFGVRSIVTGIAVRAGDGRGSISVFSDQGERMVFTLSERFAGSKYNFTTTYYHNLLSETPATSLTFSDLETYEVLDAVDFLFGEIPFTKKLRRADLDLLAFWVENRVYAQTKRGVSVPSCVSASDALVIDEYILQLLAGLNASYVLDELFTTYPPLRVEQVIDEDEMRDSRCWNVGTYF